MKSGVCAFVASLVAGSVLATDYEWTSDSVDNDASSAYDWTEGGNWKGLAAPTGLATDFVTFTNTTAGDLYVKVPDDLKLQYLQFNNTKRTTIIGEQILVSTARSPDVVPDVFSRVYADLTIPSGAAGDPGSGLYLSSVEICGDIICRPIDKHLVYNSVGHTWHRTDLYANAGGENRTNSFTRNQFNIAWGTFHFIAPQGSDDALSSVWTLAAGSRFAKRSSVSAAHVLCVGTSVAGVPGGSGAFLRRVYSDDEIELSEPASASGDYTLTFAAFSPKMVQQCFKLGTNADTEHPIDLSVHRAKDSYRFTVESVAFDAAKTSADGSAPSLVLQSSTGFPGTFEILDGSGLKSKFVFENGHVAFGEPEADDVTPGLPNASWVTMKNASSVARVTVPADLTAVMNGVTDLKGAFTKDGDGRLVLNMRDSYNGLTLRNSGAITISEGALKAVATDAGGRRRVRCAHGSLWRGAGT